MSPSADWLSPRLDEFDAATVAERRAHAYLLSGAQGSGKRILAAAMCQRAMGASATLGRGPDWPVHADFHRVTPEEGKSALSVEQIRTLIAEFTMTAYEGGAKVAVVEAADTMSISAANALLKTLEEPPGECCIILVADRLVNLPATILSRCVHWKIALPTEQAALKFIEADSPAEAMAALRVAGGAPVLAQRWLSDGTAALWQQLESELVELIQRRGNASMVAAGWAKHDIRRVLTFLLGSASALVHGALDTGRGKMLPSIPETAASGVDLKNLFWYQDRVKRLLSQPKGSFNEVGAIETLLLAWQDGFRGINNDMPALPAGYEQ